MPYRINLDIVMIILFIASVLGVNYRNPERVLFYEWLGTIILSIAVIILGIVIGGIAESGLQAVDIKGIKIELPLCILLISSVFKWKSMHIEALVKRRSLFTTMQAIAVGLFVGSILTTFIDRTGWILTILGIVGVLLVFLLSKCRIMVRTIVRSIIGGGSLGLLIAGVIKMTGFH